MNYENPNPPIGGVGQASKIFHAIVTQAGTAAPTTVPNDILINRLGSNNRVTPVWGRTSAGIYTLTMADAFRGRLTGIIQESNPTAANKISTSEIVKTDNNTVTIEFFNDAYVATDVQGIFFLWLYIFTDVYS